MKQPVHSIVRKAAIFAGIVVCLNCSDCNSVPVEQVAERYVYYVNATNNLDTARAELASGPDVVAIPGNIAFGNMSVKHKFIRNGTAMQARVHGVSKAWTGTSASSLLGTLNLVVSTSIPGANVVDLHPIGAGPSPIIAIVRDRGAAMDVYVTAPGANLATLTKDATLTKLGIIERLPVSTLHANTAFQVRLTDAGTKNVVVDFAPHAGLPEWNFHLMMAVHTNNDLVTGGFTINTRP